MEMIMRNSIQLVIRTMVAVGFAVIGVGVFGSAAPGEGASVDGARIFANRYESPVSDVDTYDDFRRRRTEQTQNT
jgi:hypothetical protein